MIKKWSVTWTTVLLFAASFGALPRLVAGEEKAPATDQDQEHGQAVGVVVVTGKEKVSATEQTAKKTNPFGDLSLTSGQGPINIRSHKLEFFYNEKRIVYRGEVVATRGDGTLKSDELTVTYEDSPAEKAAAQPAANTVTPPAANSAAQPAANTVTPRGQRIKEAVAEGNVEITSTDRRATCKKAVFNEASRTTVLSGDAVLREGGNEVRGQMVTVYMDEGRTVVERGSSPDVEMKIIQQHQENGKKEQESGKSKKGGPTP